MKVWGAKWIRYPRSPNRQLFTRLSRHNCPIKEANAFSVTPCQYSRKTESKKIRLS
uniref:Uncharacterized protein n=1 Tax=Rhizophora mucronata TaxID=61149 RepID=A0A2P2PG30_RHIMU